MKNRLLKRIITQISGYDAFISYRHEESRKYAEELHRQLSNRGMTTFLDESDEDSGTSIEKFKRIACKARSFVLVASPEVFKSKNVYDEVQAYFRERIDKWYRRPFSRIISINVDQALSKVPSEPEEWKRLNDYVYEPETKEALVNAAPSKSVVEEVAKSSGFMRTWTLFLIIVGLVITCIGVGIGGASIFLDNYLKKLFTQISVAEDRLKSVRTDSLAQARKLFEIDTTLRARENSLLTAQDKLDKAEENFKIADKLANLKTNEAKAEAINAQISRLSSTESQLRAQLSLRAYGLFPNPTSIQNLASTLSEYNHFQARLRINGTTKAVVSSNGEYIVTYSDKNGVSIYKLNYKKLTLMGKQHLPKEIRNPYINNLSISNNGNCIALNVRLLDDRLNSLVIIRTDDNWASATSTVFKENEIDSYLFNELKFSFDGKYLYGDQAKMGLMKTKGKGGVIFKLGSVVDPIIINLPDSTYQIDDIEISPNSNSIAVLYSRDISVKYDLENKLIKIFKLPNLDLKHEFKSPVSYAKALSFSNDASKIIISTDDSYHIVKNLNFPSEDLDIQRDKKNSDRLGIPSYAVNFSFFGGGRFVAVARKLSLTKDPSYAHPIPSIIILDDFEGYSNVVGRISNYGEYIDKPQNEGDIVSFGIDDNFNIITTDASGTISIWDPFIRYGAPRLSFENQINKLSLTEKYNEIFLTELIFKDNYPNQIKLSKVTNWLSNKPVVEELDKVNWYDGEFCISKKGNYYAKGTFIKDPSHKDGYKRKINIVSLTNGESLYEFDYPFDDLNNSRIAGIEISPNLKYIVAVDESCLLSIWPISKSHKKPLFITRLANISTKPSINICFGNTGDALFISADNEINVFSGLSKGKIKRNKPFIHNGNGYISNIIVNHNDSILASSLSSGSVRLWHNWHQTPVTKDISMDPDPTFFNAPSRVMSMAFHPTEDVIAILDRREVQVRDLKLDRPWIKLPRHSSDGNADIHFSADGKFIISSCYRDKNYIFWLWRPKDIINSAKEGFIYRNLAQQ